MATLNPSECIWARLCADALDKRQAPFHIPAYIPAYIPAANFFSFELLQNETRSILRKLPVNQLLGSAAWLLALFALATPAGTADQLRS